jgi:hypothetical protein
MKGKRALKAKTKVREKKVREKKLRVILAQTNMIRETSKPA